MNVVPAQVLYNNLAACHAAARRRGPIGDESVIAIPGHHRGRFTCANRSITFQLVVRQPLGKKNITLVPVNRDKSTREVFTKRTDV